MNINKKSILSVTQLNNQVKYALEKGFTSIWVEGEISNFKQYPSGHLYFTLKDDKSEISCVMFSQYASQLSSQLTQGLKVILHSDVSLYIPRGQFQLQVKNLYPSGDGKLWLEFEKLKSKLMNERLFEDSTKKKIPAFPNKIGVITSSKGAAIRDIIQVITRRAPHIHIMISPVSVQGSNAKSEIVQAIQDMNIYNEVDAIILGRGGGSLEDLWCFNEEEVARAIYDSNIPIISAVGHETDFTISDFVSDLRAATPSAAAEIISPKRDETIQFMDSIMDRIQKAINSQLKFNCEHVDRLFLRHGFHKPQLIIDRLKEKINKLSSQLNSVVDSKLKDYQFSINTNMEKINLLNPHNVLNRGYALVTNTEKEVISNTSHVHTGEDITVKFSNDQLSATVKTIRTNHG